MEEWEKRADLVEAAAATVTVGAAEGEVEDNEEAMKLKLKQASFLIDVGSMKSKVLTLCCVQWGSSTTLAHTYDIQCIYFFFFSSE